MGTDPRCRVVHSLAEGDSASGGGGL